jgi:hypothetical protein
LDRNKRVRACAVGLPDVEADLQTTGEAGRHCTCCGRVCGPVQ